MTVTVADITHRFVATQSGTGSGTSEGIAAGVFPPAPGSGATGLADFGTITFTGAVVNGYPLGGARAGIDPIVRSIGKYGHAVHDAPALRRDRPETRPSPLAAERPWRQAGRTLARDAWLRVAVLAIAAIVAACLLAPLYAHDVAHLGATWEPRRNLAAADHPGRALLALVLYAGRTSLLVASSAALIASAVTFVLVAVPAMLPGPLDWSCARIVDLAFAFPPLLLAAALSYVAGIDGIRAGPLHLVPGSLALPIGAVAVALVPSVARPARAFAKALEAGERVRSPSRPGARARRAPPRELLSGLAARLSALLPTVVARALLLETALSFLSIGVRPPNVSLGVVLGAGRATATSLPSELVAAGLAVAVVAALADSLGRRLRRVLRPRATLRRAGSAAAFALSRAAAAVLALFAVSVVVLLLFVAAGADPARRLAGRGATALEIARVGHLYGIGRPIYVQYALLVEHLFVTRDLVSSLAPGRLVVPEILHAATVSLSLLAGATVAWLLAGVAGGLVATRLSGRLVDPLASFMAVLGAAVPAYVLAALVRLAVVTHHSSPVASWFPVGGYSPPTRGVGEWALHLVLPSLSLAACLAPVSALGLRDELVGHLASPSATTARAKGVRERTVLLRHALRPSLAPVVARAGVELASVAGGSALLVEVVFHLPGVGSLVYQAVRRGDTATMIGCVTYLASFAVLVHAAYDVAARTLDPGGRRG